MLARCYATGLEKQHNYPSAPNPQHLPTFFCILRSATSMSTCRPAARSLRRTWWP